MYAKIQKGNSQSYMLIQSDAQITVNARRVTSIEQWDYMIAQQETKGECGDDSEHANFAKGLLEMLGVELGQPFLIITAPNEKWVYGSDYIEKFPMKNISIAHVNIDGVSYLTEGNIYILNDKGQTIQKV
jgi:hypothetical protein